MHHQLEQPSVAVFEDVGDEVARRLERDGCAGHPTEERPEVSAKRGRGDPRGETGGGIAATGARGGVDVLVVGVRRVWEQDVLDVALQLGDDCGIVDNDAITVVQRPGHRSPAQLLGPLRAGRHVRVELHRQRAQPPLPPPAARLTHGPHRTVGCLVCRARRAHYRFHRQPRGRHAAQGAAGGQHKLMRGGGGHGEVQRLGRARAAPAAHLVWCPFPVPFIPGACSDS
mmetsp:Transcript_7716/g.25303  ORF Transcript_7716/g.25303 Transcript_7716/m.25303 type:complete len:228 (+) Transcript_7716:1385-2068(+)